MAVTWNSSDAAANVTLSGGNLTAAMTSATQGAVRANTSFASGLLYYEAVVVNTTGTLWSIGWSNGTQSLTAALGATVNSVVYQPGSTRAFFNNASLGTLLGVVVLTRIAVALDLTNKKFYVKINEGYWNNSATADPATNTGGLPIAALGTGPYFPIFGSNGSGASVTANFGATEFSSSIPSGFSALDTNTQNYAAASKVVGYAFLDPGGASVQISKEVGYAFLDPGGTAVQISKLVGYVWLEPLPYNQFDWPNPLPRRYMRPGDVWGSNPANIPPPPITAAPFIPLDFPNPILARRAQPGFVWGVVPPTAPVASPFIPGDFPNPLRARAPHVGFVAYSAFTPAPVLGVPFIPLDFPNPLRARRTVDFIYPSFPGLIPPPSTTPQFAYLLFATL